MERKFFRYFCKFLEFFSKIIWIFAKILEFSCRLLFSITISFISTFFCNDFQLRVGKYFSFFRHCIVQWRQKLRCFGQVNSSGVGVFGVFFIFAWVFMDLAWVLSFYRFTFVKPVSRRFVWFLLLGRHVSKKARRKNLPL